VHIYIQHRIIFHGATTSRQVRSPSALKHRLQSAPIDRWIDSTIEITRSIPPELPTLPNLPVSPMLSAWKLKVSRAGESKVSQAGKPRVLVSQAGEPNSELQPCPLESHSAVVHRKARNIPALSVASQISDFRASESWKSKFAKFQIYDASNIE
jgi:hypothetical protein